MDPVKEIPELHASAENLAKNVREYAETRINYMVLDAQEKIADTAGSIVSGLVIAIMGVFLLFFLSIGAAWYIGEVTGKAFIGFFSIAGFYALAAILLYLMRLSLFNTPIANALIKKITLNEED